MTTPTPKAIEAAAAAIFEQSYPTSPWDKAAEYAKANFKRYATAALTAAAPLIVSAKTIEGVWTMTDAEFQRSLAQAKTEALREAAEWLTVPNQPHGGFPATWLRARAATLEGKDS